MRIFESPQARRRSLNAMSFFSLIMAAFVMVDYARTNVHAGDWEVAFVGAAAFAFSFALLWTVFVLALLPYRVLERWLDTRRQRRVPKSEVRCDQDSESRPIAV